MGPNRMITFKLDSFEEFGGFCHMPKGDLLRFGVNPYNGTVVLTFQDRHENACEVIEAVLNQLGKELRCLKMTEGQEKTLHDYADMADKGELGRLKGVAPTVEIGRRGNDLGKAV